MISREDLESLITEELKNMDYEELKKLGLISMKIRERGLKSLSYEELKELELKLWDIRWKTQSWIVRKAIDEVLYKVTNIIEEYKK